MQSGMDGTLECNRKLLLVKMALAGGKGSNQEKYDSDASGPEKTEKTSLSQDMYRK